MKKKQWGYHVIGAVICLSVSCIVALHETDEQASREQIAIATDKTAVMAKKQTDTIPQAEKIAPTQKQTIHTKPQAKTDTACLPTGNIVRGFGWQEKDGVWRYHSGIDIAYRKGEQVRIIKGGTVARVEACAGGYAVEVKNGDDLWRYEPLADINTRIGTQIETGTAISTMREKTTLHIARQHRGTWTEPISIQNQNKKQNPDADKMQEY